MAWCVCATRRAVDRTLRLRPLSNEASTDMGKPSKSDFVPLLAVVAALGVSSPVTASDEPEAWDVDNPPGPSRLQHIDTETGTWMNLDVDPRGEWIVFDLLGDLYRIPLTGGQAQPLSQGMAWDMQPRFSADGEWIAFTSDRTGSHGKAGDNLWILPRDGGEARQITQETFRLVNGPCWSPDGRFLVGRKHFTSRRSLGAGEMWMYPVEGVAGGASDGLQLTDRRTDQKDVNEPVFDPGGRFLYYSEDVTPGDVFEYDKDSNGQIYAIRRLDLVEQETVTLVSGPGGACRPVPSPDGQFLAFVRRVGAKTGLHLFRHEDQSVELLYDGLERDNQEAWAIHGVYPSFAFTPDGKDLVFWARGRIHRLSLHDRVVREIPFRVTDTRSIRESLRFAVDVAPETFETKMLRWVQVAPDGGSVLFQALGKLWLFDRQSGEHRRLTAAESCHEFFPSFSRDGRHVVYVCWDDVELGSVRVAPVDGGDGWTVSDAPGHYREPTFSPSGDHVVYVRTAGGSLLSPRYSQGAGVYVVDATGGAPERIARRGSGPQFGVDDERVFLTRRKGGKDSDGVEFFSVDLRQGDERIHLTSDWATEFALSPDAARVAFIERFKVHWAPFVATGRPVAIGPSTTSLPVTRLGRDAGANLRFSADSARLHWSLGPSLFTATLTAAGSDVDSEPTEERVGFDVPHDRPEGMLALVGGRLVTMSDEGVVEDGTVIVDGDRIVELGPRTEVRVPENARVIELDGRTVLPGFVDVHAHGAEGEGGILPEVGWVDAARLAFGVTTVHDPSNDTEEVFAAAEMIRAGEKLGPRTFSTGTILYGATGNFKAEIDGLEDARFHLHRMQQVGAISVKSYNQPRRDQRQQVLAAARDLGMMVVPEGGSTLMHNLTMIVDGHTGIEHTLPVEMVYDDVLDLWRGTDVGYTPTLGVAYGGLTGENWWYQQDELWKHTRLANFIPPHVLVPRARRRLLAPQEDYNHFRCSRIANLVQAEGGLVQAGGHGQLNGIDTHWEMWMFVQGGMSPMEALRCGTLYGAAYLGLDGDLGSLEVGKLADLVVYEAGRDPTTRIRDSEFVDTVVAGGRAYVASTLAPLFGEGEPPRFYWQEDGFSVGTMPLPYVGCRGCSRPGAAGWMEGR